MLNVMPGFSSPVEPSDDPDELAELPDVDAGYNGVAGS